MRATMVMSPQTTQTPLINLPPAGLNTSILFNLRNKQKEKVIFIMGATGTGKSRLSIDIATRFPSEIINSDKMQLYDGLDITTNKITKQEQQGVPHHLLSVINPNSDFSATNFSNTASFSLDYITSRDRLPIVAGGSNSYIEALVNSNSFQSKYECCFIWVDVNMSLLHSFVSDRVDQMVANGMVDEANKFFDPNGDYSLGIKRAIGVPEFDRYFRFKSFVDQETEAKILSEAILKIKEHTCRLACRQLGKIHRLRNVKGWNIHRVDATEAFRKQEKLEGEDAWNKFVTVPTAMIVDQFLHRNSVTARKVNADFASIIRVPLGRRKAIAAATH